MMLAGDGVHAAAAAATDLQPPRRTGATAGAVSYEGDVWPDVPIPRRARLLVRS